MRNFKKLANLYLKNKLSEGKQVGKIYHAVRTLDDLIEILKSDTLKSIRDIGISTSRYQNNIFATPKNINSAREAILVLDGTKIANNYKVLPFQYPNEKTSYETIIQTNHKKQNSQYPLAIDDYNLWLKDLEKNNQDEIDYAQGSALQNLHKYLIEILILTTTLNELQQFNHIRYSKENINNKIKQINILSSVPIKLI